MSDLDPVDPRLVAVIAEAQADADACHSTVDGTAHLVAKRVWAWLAEGDPA